MSFPFSRVRSSGVWSGPVWMAGLAQWFSCRAGGSQRAWCLSCASVDLPLCIASLQGLRPSDLPCDAGASRIPHPLSSFGLFHTELFWAWSFPDQTCVTCGGNLRHPHWLSSGWPGGESELCVPSGVCSQEWGLASALVPAKGILGQRGAGLGFPFLWDTAARDVVAGKGLCGRAGDVRGARGSEGWQCPAVGSGGRVALLFLRQGEGLKQSSLEKPGGQRLRWHARGAIAPRQHREGTGAAGSRSGNKVAKQRIFPTGL